MEYHILAVLASTVIVSSWLMMMMNAMPVITVPQMEIIPLAQQVEALQIDAPLLFQMRKVIDVQVVYGAQSPPLRALVAQ